jgi:hypothetical protein
MPRFYFLFLNWEIKSFFTRLQYLKRQLEKGRYFMMKKILIVFLGSVFCVSCTAGTAKVSQKTAPAKEVTQKAAECPGGDKVIIGEAEKIRILPADVIYDARIDTGATTTSLHAGNMEFFERDGKKWVKFDLEGENKTETVEMKIKEYRNIKRHGAPDQKRPVVTVRLVLGHISQMVDVTLNDRSRFTYPGLVGRNFLRDMMIVDVSKKYTAKPAKK